jgi:hypothetical protein
MAAGGGQRQEQCRWRGTWVLDADVDVDADCVDARQQTSTGARESHKALQGAFEQVPARTGGWAPPIPTRHGNKRVVRESGARSQ